MLLSALSFSHNLDPEEALATDCFTETN
jgi:hypothetical protein